ncbi:NAD(P)/FAD-dependent oxidoreductase [Clostridiaceae bacterium 35-E11]
MLETVIVIGGGASGMMAAGTAASRGKNVILLEKNDKLGKKIYITGKGRCNITNLCDPEEILNNVTSNKHFLYSALYSFNSEDVVKLMNKYETQTKVERGNRVFPVSDKSNDVIRALSKYMKSNNVNIMLNAEVQNILVQENNIIGVKLSDGRVIECNKIIIATGGLSYPTTGSTGDGYRIAKHLGHKITPLKPALVPLEVEESWVKDLQGLSLKNVSLTASYKNQSIHTEFGEMIFTHYGISGPIVLTMSNYINTYLTKGKIHATLNLKPALSQDILDKRIQRDFEKYSKKQFKNSLNDLLPAKLIPVIIKLSGIPEDKYTNQITKEERIKLINLLTNLSITIVKPRPIKEAIITAGGISVKEINPSTMESKKINNLYFVGEIIDVEGLTGGYNLQIAFSTGYLAGISV